MRYLRLTGCLVNGRECFFRNHKGEYIAVGNKPLNAHEGDIFCVVQITSEGTVSGIVYFPDWPRDRIRSIYRDWHERVTSLPDFMSAWSEAMRLMPLAACVATPGTLDKKVGIVFDPQTMRDAVSFAMEKGIFAEMAGDMDKALAASHAHGKWMPMFRKIAELLLEKRKSLKCKAEKEPTPAPKM